MKKYAILIGLVLAVATTRLMATGISSFDPNLGGGGGGTSARPVKLMDIVVAGQPYVSTITANGIPGATKPTFHSTFTVTDVFGFCTQGSTVVSIALELYYSSGSFGAYYSKVFPTIFCTTVTSVGTQSLSPDYSTTVVVGAGRYLGAGVSSMSVVGTNAIDCHVGAYYTEQNYLNP